MSNNDTDARPSQGKNEPVVLGADESRASAAPVAADDIDVEDMTTDELLAASRNAESRVNVFNTLAQMDSARHGKALEQANADFRKYADALKEHNYDPAGNIIDPSLTVLDKEGTAPTLADATGTFAKDAETANMGGIGINDSNADPEGALEKLNERAGRDDMTNAAGTSPLMSRDTTIKARKERRERVPLVEREPA